MPNDPADALTIADRALAEHPPSTGWWSPTEGIIRKVGDELRGPLDTQRWGPVGEPVEGEQLEVQAFPAPALVVRPGDRVLIALNHMPDARDVHRMQNYLAQRIPGVTFAFVGDVAGLAVVPAGE